jgi:hypothetical protein
MGDVSNRLMVSTLIASQQLDVVVQTQAQGLAIKVKTMLKA